MPDIVNESEKSKSEKIRQAISKIVRDILVEETKSCFRIYKAKVVTVPNGTTCEIQLVGDEKTMNLPYSSKVSNVLVGAMVWVATIYDSFSNAIVWETINFQ
nr:MAG TPA: hemolytic lectin [Caudoviricetes sp.]